MSDVHAELGFGTTWPTLDVFGELARTRRLLAHRHELDEMRRRVDQEHLSLVPLALYFKGGRAKLELGLGRGRKHYDKRQLIAQRDADLDARRAMAAARRRPEG